MLRKWLGLYCNILLVYTNVENLPKPSTYMYTLIQMTSEMKGLACQQLAEQLTRTKDLALASQWWNFKIWATLWRISSFITRQLVFIGPMWNAYWISWSDTQITTNDSRRYWSCCRNAGDGIRDKILANIKKNNNVWSAYSWKEIQWFARRLPVGNLAIKISCSWVGSSLSVRKNS